MTTNQLKYFITAAETLSFTEAGKLHYISQTAITQHIQSLEEQLGVKLFDRNKKRVYLTPAGEIFYMEAKAILERSKIAINKARNAADGISGSLNIGYVKGQAFSLVSPLIKNFYLQNPSVKFQLFRQAHLDLLMNLEQGKLDFIFNIVYGNTDLTDFSYRRIASDRLYAVLPPGHPYAQLSSIRRYDLRDEPFLLTKYYEDPSARKYGHVLPDKLRSRALSPRSTASPPTRRLSWSLSLRESESLFCPSPSCTPSATRRISPLCRWKGNTSMSISWPSGRTLPSTP